MNTKEKNRIVLIFGRKWSGKTTLLKKMINKIKREKSILIIDKLNKFNTEPEKTFDNHLDLYNYMKTTDETFVVSIQTTCIYEIQAAIMAAYCIGNVTIFIDEADDIFGNFMSDEMKDVILRGRNQGIDLVMTTLRAHKLGIDVRNQADIIYCFNVVNKTAVQTIISEFGRPELKEIISSLRGKDHEYIKYDIEKNEVSIFVKGKDVAKRVKDFELKTA